VYEEYLPLEVRALAYRVQVVCDPAEQANQARYPRVDYFLHRYWMCISTKYIHKEHLIKIKTAIVSFDGSFPLFAINFLRS